MLGRDLILKSEEFTFPSFTSFNAASMSAAMKRSFSHDLGSKDIRSFNCFSRCVEHCLVIKVMNIYFWLELRLHGFIFLSLFTNQYADETSLTFARANVKHINIRFNYDLSLAYTWLSEFDGN